MVVTFVTPTTGAPFGPGHLISLDSDFVGPLSVGSIWSVTITGEGSPGETMEIRSHPTTTNAQAWAWNEQPTYVNPLLHARPGALHGDSVTVEAKLFDGGTQVDAGSVVVTWDLVSGVPFILQGLVQEQVAVSAAAGEQLESIDNAVHLDFGGLGRFGLGELVGLPSAGFMIRQTITPDRSGEGTLDRPGLGLDVAAMGLEWEWVTIPPGNGLRSGAPPRAARRVLDLELVGTDGAANEYIRTFESFDVEHLRYTFNPVGLTRIHYWIEPGSVLRFHWLILA